VLGKYVIIRCAAALVHTEPDSLRLVLLQHITADAAGGLSEHHKMLCSASAANAAKCASCLVDTRPNYEIAVRNSTAALDLKLEMAT
jgi:hypothetical protein